MSLAVQPTFSFLRSCGILHSCSGDLPNVMAEPPPVFVSSRRCVILPAAFLLLLIRMVNARAHLPRPATVLNTPPSLRVPTGVRSYSVSAYGVLQEACYLLTVLLHSKQNTFKIRCEVPVQPHEWFDLKNTVGFDTDV